MTNEQAFQVLAQGLQIANKAGAFTLQDSAQVYQALAQLGKQYEVEQPKEEAPENEPKAKKPLKKV